MTAPNPFCETKSLTSSIFENLNRGAVVTIWSLTDSFGREQSVIGLMRPSGRGTAPKACIHFGPDEKELTADIWPLHSSFFTVEDILVDASFAKIEL